METRVVKLLLASQLHISSTHVTDTACVECVCVCIFIAPVGLPVSRGFVWTIYYYFLPFYFFLSSLSLDFHFFPSGLCSTLYVCTNVGLLEYSYSRPASFFGSLVRVRIVATPLVHRVVDRLIRGRACVAHRVKRNDGICPLV